MAKLPVVYSHNYNHTPQKAFQRWWLSDSSDVHQHLLQLIKLIEENQKEQRHQDMRHSYLYNNHLSGSGGADSLPNRYHVTYNVVKSCIDTVTAKISQRELRPRVLTERGDYGKQQRARKLTKYLDGLFDSGGVYRLGPQVLKDAGIFGTGAIKIVPDYDKKCVKFERVVIDELLVDDLEARYGDPQSLYQIRLVSRDLLAEKFPKARLAIESLATETDLQYSSYSARAVDMIKVYEGWHLGDNGRHVMAVEGCTLLDQPWEHSGFPFAFLRYSPQTNSFYGQGIAEELLGTQLEINKLLRDIQRAQHLIAVPRVLIEESAKIIPSHLNNEIGSALKYRGTKPDFFTPVAMNNEIYNHVKWLVQSAYEKVGVSQLSATSKKPVGLDSKPALREFAKIESERFAVTEMNYQYFFADLAKLAIIWSRELYKKNPSVEIKAENRKFIETIKWSEADIEDDVFVTRVYTSSLLPKSPTAKLQKIEEYVQAGWMNRETALQLFDHPDVEAWETVETTEKNFIEMCIGDILEKGKYRAPEPEIDPVNAINLAKKAYLEALQHDVPMERIELLLRWIEAVSSLLPDIASPVAPDMGAALGMAPAAPTSNLLPMGTVPPMEQLPPPPVQSGGI